MKTEKEINERIVGAKQDMLDVIPSFKKAIEDEDWEEVIQYCSGFTTGVCVINVAQGFLED